MSANDRASQPAHELSPGAVQRLTDHYGPSITPWLRSVPALVVRAATRHRLQIQGFHDAGWTSVVAAAIDSVGRRLIIKAVPDHRRFAREVAVLTHWEGNGSCRLIHADPGNQVLLVSAVEKVGGGRRPPDHQARVAGVLPRLHSRPASVHPDVPDLARSFRQRIAPRLVRQPPIAV
jgi:streptomycin 6-kinase